MRSLVLFAVPLLIAGCNTTEPPTQKSEITQLLARAMTVGLQAQQSCPNVVVSAKGLIAIQKAAGINEDEQKKLMDTLVKAQLALSYEIERQGVVAWCKSTLEIYGDDGLKTLVALPPRL